MIRLQAYQCLLEIYQLNLDIPHLPPKQKPATSDGFLDAASVTGLNPTACRAWTLLYSLSNFAFLIAAAIDSRHLHIVSHICLSASACVTLYTFPCILSSPLAYTNPNFPNCSGNAFFSFSVSCISLTSARSQTSHSLFIFATIADRLFYVYVV